MTDDPKLYLTTLRLIAVKYLSGAREQSEVNRIAVESRKINNYDKEAEENGWRFCERCNSYEEYDDDKCARCSAPLYKYSARGEQGVR